MLDRAAFLRPYAHRGLHDAGRGIVENTVPAFEAAIGAGYGIECDLRSAAGGVPLVFHDATLERLTDASGPVAALTPAQLKVVRHRQGGAPIATFAELLALTRGRVPILAEVKSEWEPPMPGFIEEIARLAEGYDGPLALMSFDPDVTARLKELAPAVSRGIVSGSYFDKQGRGWWPGSALTDQRRRALAGLKESAATAPDFYAYEVGALPTPETERARAAGLPVFTWTVRTDADRATAARYADAPIFEGYLA